MVIKTKKRFTKDLEKAPANIKLAFSQRVDIFRHNPFDSLLNNHALGGKYKGFRSINIMSDWRVIFREAGSYQLVIFEAIGTHSRLYKK